MKNENYMTPENGGEIIIYESADGMAKIDVRFVDETVWLTQTQLVELFQSSKANISEHIKNIFSEGELDESATVRKFRTVQLEGERRVAREVAHYNLDMIISLGYRVKSKIATHFRKWATARLKEFLVKGFTMDDERLKQLGGGNYWKELLDRIRDIRSSEKVFYRQVLDLYATSVDYDPKSEKSVLFFKIVQNKLHYAAHGHTAAEVIYDRADAEAPFMGLQTFSGDFPTLKDIGIAKNYLGNVAKFGMASSFQHVVTHKTKWKTLSHSQTDSKCLTRRREDAKEEKSRKASAHPDYTQAQLACIFFDAAREFLRLQKPFFMYKKHKCPSVMVHTKREAFNAKRDRLFVHEL